MTIPAFTGKKQLEGIDVEQSTTMANVRIHVERVIGNIYEILGTCIRTCTSQLIDYLIAKNHVTLLDILTVSCALNNLCNSVITFDKLFMVVMKLFIQNDNFMFTKQNVTTIIFYEITIIIHYLINN